MDAQQHNLQQQLRESALAIHDWQGQHHRQFLGKYSGFEKDFINTLIGLMIRIKGIKNSWKIAKETTRHLDVSKYCIPRQPNTFHLSKWSSLNFYPHSQHH